jgi:hypothetical protein
LPRRRRPAAALGRKSKSFHAFAENTADIEAADAAKPDRQVGAAFLREFVEEAKASGLVASLIEKHRVTGRLTVAPPA